jgi:hypothetical protein
MISVRTAAIFWALSALIALIAGSIGAVFVLVISRGREEPFVAWLGDWLRTPGFGGACAVVAAGIALVGISIQLGASRSRDSESRWWLTFEWASDRGLPRSPSEASLPFDATLSTFNALASAARTDTQRSAIRGLVDEVVRLREVALRLSDSSGADIEELSEESSGDGADDVALDGSEAIDDARGDDREPSPSSLARYVLDQVGTAAESRRANALAYETEVFRALRHQYRVVRTSGGYLGGDLIVDTGKGRLVVAVKWSSRAAFRYSPTTTRFADVVISNAEVVGLPSGSRSVRWKLNDRSSILRRALDAIARLRAAEL